jgi:hypothetical protein
LEGNERNIARVQHEGIIRISSASLSRCFSEEVGRSFLGRAAGEGDTMVCEGEEADGRGRSLGERHRGAGGQERELCAPPFHIIANRIVVS